MMGEIGNYEKISWKDFVNKLKIGDIIMVSGNDGTIQEVKYEGSKSLNGILEIDFQPLAIEWIKKMKMNYEEGTINVIG